MTSSRMENRVNLLLNKCLNSAGKLDESKTLAVFRAVAGSMIEDKIKVLREFNRKISLIESRQRAVVTSTQPLGGAATTDLTAWLKTQYPAISAISWQIDQQLLGGITIQAGDMWYDLSVQHRLTMIEEQLG